MKMKNNLKYFSVGKAKNNAGCANTCAHYNRYLIFYHIRQESVFMQRKSMY